VSETGEKYPVARRMVIAAQDGAIRGAVQQSLERLVGLSAVDVDLAADRVHVTIRAARPGMVWGLLRPTEGEGVWRDSAAEQLRAELEESATPGPNRRVSR
jgi:ribosomal protein S3